jgi:hypothetical protein
MGEWEPTAPKPPILDHDPGPQTPPQRRSGRPRLYDERVSTQIRMTPELHDALVEAAYERDLPINYLVCRAIEEYLARLIPVEELRLTRPDPPSLPPPAP